MPLRGSENGRRMLWPRKGSGAAGRAPRSRCSSRDPAATALWAPFPLAMAPLGKHNLQTPCGASPPAHRRHGRFSTALPAPLRPVPPPRPLLTRQRRGSRGRGCRGPPPAAAAAPPQDVPLSPVPLPRSDRTARSERTHSARRGATPPLPSAGTGKRRARPQARLRAASEPPPSPPGGAEGGSSRAAVPLLAAGWPLQELSLLPSWRLSSERPAWPVPGSPAAAGLPCGAPL